MSFDINWASLVSDENISSQLQSFLDQQLNNLKLPDFIDKLTVTQFSLGTKAPDITIRHIGNPFEEFYHDAESEDEERRNSNIAAPHMSDSESSASFCGDDGDQSAIDDSRNQINVAIPSGISPAGSSDIIKQIHNHNMNNVGLGTAEIEPRANLFNHAYKLRSGDSSRQVETKKSENDIQFVLDVDYHGDMMIEISVSLLVNFPSQQFISLPIKLKITDLVIHSLAVIAYVRKCVYISFLCDLNDSNLDYFTSSNSAGQNLDQSMGNSNLGGNFVDYTTASNRERIDVIKSVKIDTEIGEVESNVLRNVGKVEKFLVEQLRSILRDEVSWPSWICLDLESTDSDSNEEDI